METYLISDLLAKIATLRVLIIGDVMIDRYMRGSVQRVSPEAPVPVVHLQDEENRLGGAANVALNCMALGATPVLCSVIGDDENGRLLRSLLQANQFEDAGIISHAERKTTVKTRVMSGSQHLLRVDREDARELSQDAERELLGTVKSLMQQDRFDVIVFQDYNKGVLTAQVIRSVISWAQQQDIPTAVDPKWHHIFDYQGVTIFKPNFKEIKEAVPFAVSVDVKSLQDASDYMRERLQHDISLITLSEHGLFVDSRSQAGKIYPTQSRTIVDVCGAGDAVISIAALALASGCPIEQIAQLSNLCGGQACERVGVCAINRKQLAAEYARWKGE